MDDYISKPVRRDEMFEALRKWLAPQRIEDESSGSPSADLAATSDHTLPVQLG
jgi:hypothetical protein